MERKYALEVFVDGAWRRECYGLFLREAVEIANVVAADDVVVRIVEE